jgi:hypothetical protein
MAWRRGEVATVPRRNIAFEIFDEIVTAWTIYGVERRCHSLSSAANRFALSDIVVAFGMGSEGAAARFTGGLPQREFEDSLAEELSGVEVPFVAVEVLFVSCAFANDAADAIEMIANAAPSF